MEWLISANSKIYDHKTSFLKYGYIDWHQSYNFAIGDIVYIYSSRPESSISFATKVDDINMVFSEIRDDKIFWKSLDSYEKSKNGLYCKLTLISQIHNESLSLKNLKLHGLKVAPQGALKLRGELRDYIIANSFRESIDDLLEKTHKLLEGAPQQVLINRYERNIEARKICLQHYGYTCSICRFDFERQYGVIGKNFIHVHHIVPLSDIQTGYVVNPMTDLIPVCPNCHAMLHKKDNNGNELTVQGLKKLIKTFCEHN